MNRQPTVLVLLGGALALLACPAVEAQMTVTVEGPGTVTGVSGPPCRATCLMALPVGTFLVATPDEAGRFVGWEGACTGPGSCAVQPDAAVVARFLPDAHLRLSIEGSGVVTLSDGRTCSAVDSPCGFDLAGPTTLTPVPAAGFRFAGYSGSCLGSSVCSLSRGDVTATFTVKAPTIDIHFSGDGGGTIRDLSDAVVCSSDCSVEVQPGVEYDLRAFPSAGSVFAGFAPPCGPTACRVTAPATVEARFDIGRLVIVQTAGRGSGEVTVNGQAGCSGGCSLIVPRSAPVSIEAAPVEYSRFEGFSGDCQGDGGCTLPAGDTAVSVTAGFDKVLQWVRSFPVLGSPTIYGALLAEPGGITAALSSTWGANIEGTAYGASAGNQGGTVIVALSLDGGVTNVVALSEPIVDGGLRFNATQDLVRGTNGELLAFGYCFGGWFQGAECGSVSASGGAGYWPFAVSLGDGGVTTVAVWNDQPGSYFAEAFARPTGLLVRMGRPAASSTAFMQIPYDFDGGTVVLEAPELYAASEDWPHNCANDDVVRCVTGATGPADAGLCASPAGATTSRDLQVVSVSETGVCTPSLRSTSMSATSRINARAVTRVPQNDVVAAIGYAEGPVDVAPGFTVPAGAHHWLGWFSRTQVLNFVSSPRAPGGGNLSDVVWGNSGLISAFGSVGASGAMVFGKQVTWLGPFLVTFDDQGTPTRLWAMPSADYGQEPFLARTGDLTIVLVSGRDMWFGPDRLSNDAVERFYIMALRE